mgnify:CR=1 FL=1
MKPMTDIVIYETGEARVEVRLDRETVWLTQEQMSQLFGRERSVITKHIRNVFSDGELEREAVCAKFAHTAADGKTYHLFRHQEPPFFRWNRRLIRDGEPVINDVGLVALALPERKDG